MLRTTSAVCGHNLSAERLGLRCSFKFELIVPRVIPRGDRLGADSNPQPSFLSKQAGPQRVSLREGVLMAIPDITRESVTAAIQEFDALGRQAFLDKYGFGRARAYYILHADKLYDSNAILGAAHGFLGPGNPPLGAEDFSGGERRVARLLRRLGFAVQAPNEPVNERIVPFVPGRIYHRQRDIHQEFGGQERGGIATPTDVPFLFLFTGENGAQYGYRDGPMDDGSYAYCGEGQLGDQEFVRGNRAIRDHAKE